MFLAGLPTAFFGAAVLLISALLLSALLIPADDVDYVPLELVGGTVPAFEDKKNLTRGSMTAGTDAVPGDRILVGTSKSECYKAGIVREYRRSFV